MNSLFSSRFPQLWFFFVVLVKLAHRMRRILYPTPHVCISAARDGCDGTSITTRSPAPFVSATTRVFSSRKAEHLLVGRSGCLSRRACLRLFLVRVSDLYTPLNAKGKQEGRGTRRWRWRQAKSGDSKSTQRKKENSFGEHENQGHR